MLYVHEHNLESPSVRLVNRGKSYILFAVLLIGSSRDR